MEKKKVIYTCVVDGYDNVQQPEAIDETFDYICFSDDTSCRKNGVWDIRPIPFSHDSKVYVSRYPKILPHVVLPEYDYSVYLDANIQIAGREFYSVINSFIANDCLVAQVPHCIPPVDCIYDDIGFAYKLNKVTLGQVLRHARHLRKNHFPAHFGLFENNVILRRHNDAKVMAMSEMWWSEFMSYIPRDQFSLMYVYWKSNFMPPLLFGENVCARNAPFLNYSLHLNEIDRRPSLMKKLEWRWYYYSYPVVRLFI